MEYEANHLHTERAQLHEQSTAFRDGFASLRTESQQLEDKRVELDQAAAFAVAGRECADRWEAELSEQRLSIAASEDYISRTCTELADAINRVGRLEDAFNQRGNELVAVLEEVRAHRAMDRTQIDELNSRVDFLQEHLDTKFDSMIHNVAGDARLIGQSLDNKIETLRRSMEQYIANNNRQGVATEQFVQDARSSKAR